MLALQRDACPVGTPHTAARTRAGLRPWIGTEAEHSAGEKAIELGVA
jgi:hypothetical protein